MPVKYDEIRSVPEKRIREYFASAGTGGCEIAVTPMPERQIGRLSFPQTRVVIEGERAEEVYRAFSLNFLSGGA